MQAIIINKTLLTFKRIETVDYWNSSFSKNNAILCPMKIIEHIKKMFNINKYLCVQRITFDSFFSVLFFCMTCGFVLKMFCL